MLSHTKQWTQLLREVRAGRRVCIHSAEVREGDVFVALPGSRRRGTDFIAEALQRGAAWIVSDQGLDPGLSPGRASIVIQPDAGQALGALAVAKYRTGDSDYQLVGITGTNGKTTVCFGLEYLLHSAGQRVGCLGTITYRWPGHEQPAGLTTPGCLQLHEILARMEKHVDTVCMEVSSHALEQQRTAGLHFDLGLFTNLTHDHLDYHQDMDSYYLAKRRLFFPDQDGRPFPVLNLDDPYGRKLANEAGQGLGFGLHQQVIPGFDCLQGRLQRLSKEGLQLEMQFCGERWELNSLLLGRHNASNLLAIQAAGLRLGLTPKAMQSLSDFAGVPGRLERITGTGRGYVFVDYAHTPDALDNVLRSIREVDFKRVIVVFGCGGNRDIHKRPLMGQVAARHADVAVLTSDNPRDEDPLAIMHDVFPGLQGAPRLVQEPDRAKAIELALDAAGPDDAVLIAGKGHETYQEIKGVRYPFSDQDIVKAIGN